MANLFERAMERGREREREIQMEMFCLLIVTNFAFACGIVWHLAATRVP